MDRQAQLKAERERRQARIKASGANRLAKITGAAGTQDFKEPVKPTPAPAAPTAVSAPPDLLSALNGSNGLDLSALQAMLGQQPSGTPNGEKTVQKVNKRTERTDLAWELVHILSSVVLGIYAALGNPWNITMVFLTLQVAELVAQTILKHVSTGLPSFVAPFVGMLPRKRQLQLNTAGALITAIYTGYRDFSIVLLVFGLASFGGRDFKRPI